MGRPRVQNSPLIFCAGWFICLACFAVAFDADRIKVIEKTGSELREILSTRVLLSDLKSLCLFCYSCLLKDLTCLYSHGGWRKRVLALDKVCIKF